MPDQCVPCERYHAWHLGQEQAPVEAAKDRVILAALVWFHGGPKGGGHAGSELADACQALVELRCADDRT